MEKKEIILRSPNVSSWISENIRKKKMILKNKSINMSIQMEVGENNVLQNRITIWKT